MENAIAYTATEQAYNGEIISIKIDDKYRTYRLQPTSDGYELESLEQVQKAYVQIIDEFPTENQEEGIIYIVGSTGKIWNGSEYLTVFEDLQPIRDELNKKAPIDSPEFTGKVTIDGVEVPTVESVDSKLRLSEPYITGRELVANGYGLIIDALDDNTNRATYYTSGQKKYIDFPSGYSVVGGAVDNNVFSSSIVMNSGNVNIIQGGSAHLHIHANGNDHIDRRGSSQRDIDFNIRGAIFTFTYVSAVAYESTPVDGLWFVSYAKAL